MSIQDTLNQYGISMQNFALPPNYGPFASGGVSVNKKIFLGGDFMESFFGLTYRNPDNLDDTVIRMVSYVVNGNNPPLDTIEENYLGSFSTTLVIYPDVVCFYGGGTGEIQQSVPINDFLVIATAWRDFLRQPPLNAAAV